jgi:hypothetical protein
MPSSKILSMNFDVCLTAREFLQTVLCPGGNRIFSGNVFPIPTYQSDGPSNWFGGWERWLYSMFSQAAVAKDMAVLAAVGAVPSWRRAKRSKSSETIKACLSRQPRWA